MAESPEGPYAEEARERWGETDAYRESTKRLSGYTAEQKALVFKAQQDATEAVARAMRAGHRPESVEAIAAAELCRLAIDQWFYPCDTDMHCNLAAMYVSDDRFRHHYDTIEPGLAQYLHDAIVANARHAG